MKRILLKFAITFICSYSYNLFAEDTKLKLNGLYEVQFGIYNSNISKRKPLTSNQHHFGLNSSTNFNLDLNHKYKDEFSYGVILGIETTARNNRRVPSMLYLTSPYGRFELGSNKSANSKMKITAYSLAAATAGGWDSWTNLTLNSCYLSYVSSYGNFLDLKTRKSGKVEYSRKITYYSPKIAGLQFGVSYIPDTSNVGYDILNPKHHHHDPVKPSNYLFSIKNGLAYGITYDTKISKLGLKFAAVGENGRVISEPRSKNIETLLNAKFTNLFTYILGAEVAYDKYSVAAAYSNYNRSLTSAVIDKNRDTHIYSVGTKYQIDTTTFSFNHFYSIHKKNKLNASTLAIDHKVTNGILIYGEITYYQTYGKFIKNNLPIKDRTRGTVFLTGFKVYI